MTRKPKIFRVDEAEAAVLIYNEGTPLTRQEFLAEAEAMRKGLREADGRETQAQSVQNRHPKVQPGSNSRGNSG